MAGFCIYRYIYIYKIRYTYGDISITTRMYIHARLQFVSHLDFPLFFGQIYRVDHGRGNDFDEADRDT